MMTEQREGPAEVRPDLFLPRHPGDVVRLITALAVLLVSIKLVNRNHIDELMDGGVTASWFFGELAPQ
jgi:hypothetical protein